MSAGFILSEALAKALKPSYSKGDLDVTVKYLVEGLKLGQYRIMVKKNFDTACWIPPVGKRGSHSIYYGDRMLARVIRHFVELNAIDMPDEKSIAAKLKAKPTIKSRAKSVTKPNAIDKSAILDAQASWLQENLSDKQYQTLQDWLVSAVSALGRHEREHARQTTQNLKQVNKDLKDLKIPFMYFNLFEDARIEHRSRQELDIPFGWTMFQALAPMDNPINLVLRCIQLEGEPDKEALDNDAPYTPRPTLSLGHIADSVESYYQRACRCTTSEQLYPIIMEFLAEFKDDIEQLNPPKPEKSEDSGDSDSAESSDDSSDSGDEGSDEKGSKSSAKSKDKKKPGAKNDDSAAPDADQKSSDSDAEGDSDAKERAGDLSTAADAAEEGDSFFDSFEEDAEVVGGTDAEGKAAEAKAKAALSEKTPEKGVKAKGIPDSIGEVESGGEAKEADFLARKAGIVDDTYQKRVTDLTSMLMRMFKTHTLSQATESLGHRISSRHIARGELRFIHRKVYGGKGKRKYTIVYDCSGSMSGKPDREGKLFLLALNNLAKTGYLEGSLILSGWVNGKPGWLSYKFPVKDDIILRIDPSHGSEGLQAALYDNLKKIVSNDDVFVYTDSCICDAPIKRELFAAKRIWPVGLYVGKQDDASEMERHFPQNIIRNSIEEVAEALLTRNRRTVG